MVATTATTVATVGTMPENKSPPPRLPPATRVRPAMSPAERRAWETQQGPKPKAVSGNAMVGQGARGTRPDPLWAIEVVRGSWVDAEPRTLQLGTMPAGVTPNSRAFPISTDQRAPGASYEAWQLARLGDDASEVFMGNGFPVACLLEYGCGAAGSRVMFDWVPGSYNLPPCTYANVSVLPWGPVFESNWNETSFSAAVSAGSLQGAHVPTVSASYALAEDDYVTIPVPDHARYFDVVSTLSTDEHKPAGSLAVSGASVGLRDFGAGVYSPGWSPLDVTVAGGSVNEVTVRCLDDGGSPSLAFQLRWYLAL